jgi:hypothetical protein
MHLILAPSKDAEADLLLEVFQTQHLKFSQNKLANNHLKGSQFLTTCISTKISRKENE